MKLTSLIENIKQKHHRPAVFIAVALLVYLVFVSGPHLFQIMNDLWRARCSPGLFVFTFIDLFFLLASLTIWLLSIFVTWAAFQKSRKIAYLFILAYFLMPLVVQPGARMTRNIITRYAQQHQRQQPSTELEIAQQKPKTIEKNIKLDIPVGPLLLLVGVWYLYKKEETKDEEPHSDSEETPHKNDDFRTSV
jgi:hypothetical protein